MFPRTHKLRLSIIKQMELRAAAYPDVISLAQGIPDFDTPGCIKRRVERALERGAVARYSLSPGLPELREMIEISLARKNMYYDWQNEIIVTAGAIEAITASIFAVTEPGDEVIIPDPTYVSYREAIILAGCRPVYAPLDETNGWAFDIEKFETAITNKTRAIFYCNPNNPTGTVYSRDQLTALAGLAVKHGLFLISDEVYKDFVYKKSHVSSDCHPESRRLGTKDPEVKEKGAENKKVADNRIFSLAEVPELRKRVIRIFSFSKSYAMTGWRVGYVHSDESVIREILKVHDCLVTCAPVISQYAGLGALEMGESDVRKFREKYEKRRDLICSRLDEMKDIFTYIKPNSAYYIFPRVKNAPDSQKFALDLLERAQVAVVPGIAFGPSGEGHIRMSFGRSEKDINTAFDRITMSSRAPG